MGDMTIAEIVGKRGHALPYPEAGRISAIAESVHASMDAIRERQRMTLADRIDLQHTSVRASIMLLREGQALVRYSKRKSAQPAVVGMRATAISALSMAVRAVASMHRDLSRSGRGLPMVQDGDYRRVVSAVYRDVVSGAQPAGVVQGDVSDDDRQR